MPAIRYVLMGVALAVVVAGFVLPKALSPGHSVSNDRRSASAAAHGTHSREPLRVTAVALHPSVLNETISSTGSLLADEGVELQAIAAIEAGNHW